MRSASQHQLLIRTNNLKVVGAESGKREKGRPGTHLVMASKRWDAHAGCVPEFFFVFSFFRNPILGRTWHVRSKSPGTHIPGAFGVDFEFWFFNSYLFNFVLI